MGRKSVIFALTKPNVLFCAKSSFFDPLKQICTVRLPEGLGRWLKGGLVLFYMYRSGWQGWMVGRRVLGVVIIPYLTFTNLGKKWVTSVTGGTECMLFMLFNMILWMPPLRRCRVCFFAWFCEFWFFRLSGSKKRDFGAHKAKCVILRKILLFRPT